jgi:hypothetical protein
MSRGRSCLPRRFEFVVGPNHPTCLCYLRVWLVFESFLRRRLETPTAQRSSLPARKTTPSQAHDKPLPRACFLNAVPYYSRGVFIRHESLQDAAEGKDILEQHEFAVDYVTSYDYALAKSQDTGQLDLLGFPFWNRLAEPTFAAEATAKISDQNQDLRNSEGLIASLSD